MTTQTQHTPGPWKISERAGNFDSRINSYAITCGSAGNYLAIVEASGNAALSNKANATLISAAPELADVLRELVADLDCNDPYEKSLRKARAALAKVAA